MRRISKLGTTALATLSLVGLTVTPTRAAEIVNVRVGRHPDVTRVVIDLQRPARYAVHQDASLGLTVSLDPNGAPTLALPKEQGGAGVVKAVRVESGAAVAIALTESAEVARAFTLEPDAEYGTYRIVLDLREAPRGTLAAATPTEPAATASPVPEADTDTALADEGSIPQAAADSPATDSAASETQMASVEDPFAMGGDDAMFNADASGGAAFEAAGAEGGLFDGLSVDGYVEVEGRVFPQDSRNPDPKNQTASLAAEPSVHYTWGGGRQSVTFTPFGRVDSNDHERTHADIRELKYVGAFDRVTVRVGIDKVFWGVTESVHLVDVLNQDDQLEDIDGEDKLGQPMASVTVDSGFGLFSAYVMTYFRERQFAGIDGRPRGPILIDSDHALYEAGSDKWHVDWAVRWSHAFDHFDVALSHFHGTNRDPLFLPGVDGGGNPVLIPYYNLIDQTGVEMQATFGGLLLKAEGIRRAQVGENQVAAVAGFEYTAYNILSGSSDVGFLMEYLWDDRGRNPDNPFEDDLFAALRWTANDVSGTTLLAGAIFDLDTRTKFVNIEASRRLGSRWKISLDARLLLTVPVSDPLYPFSDDDFVQLKVQRFF